MTEELSTKTAPKAINLDKITPKELNRAAVSLSKGLAKKKVFVELAFARAKVTGKELDAFIDRKSA